MPTKQKHIFVVFILLLISLPLIDSLSFASAVKNGKCDIRSKDQIIDIECNNAKINDIISQINESCDLVIKINDTTKKEQRSTFKYENISLKELLPKILEKNYAILIKNDNTVAKALATSSIKNESHQDNNNGNHQIVSRYVYPITPDSPEWGRLESFEQMFDATQIPGDILKAMSTVALLESLVSHPLLVTLTAQNDMSHGFDIFCEKFNGCEELIRRDDVFEVLLNNELKSQKNRSDTAYSYSFDENMSDMGIDYLLAKDEVIHSLSEERKDELLTKFVQEFKLIDSDHEKYGTLPLHSKLYLIQQLLISKGAISDSTTISADDINRITIQ